MICRNPECGRDTDTEPYCCGPCSMSHDDGDRVPGHSPLCNQRSGTEPRKGRGTAEQAVIDATNQQEEP